jgi:hypothetical protein
MKKLIYAALASAIVLLSCESNENDPGIRQLADESTLVVSHYKRDMTGVGPMLGLIIQKGESIGTNDWQFFYDNIEGFDYEWGYVYKLQVAYEEIPNPPADGSSIKTKLVKVISKEKVSDHATFKIRLAYDDGGYFTFVSGDLSSGLRMSDEVSLDCGSLCAQLAAHLAAKRPLIGEFVHEANGIRLVELKVQ